MDNTDFEIYEGKSFASLCKNIVENSEEKKTQLDILIQDLKEMIKTLPDAVQIVPLLKEYFDVGIRNDEQLVKLAAIVQRLIMSQLNPDEGGQGLSEDEKKQLLTIAEETVAALKFPPKDTHK